MIADHEPEHEHREQPSETWAEDDGALKDIAALQKVAMAVRSTTSTFAKAVFYLVVASGAALAGIESITHDGIKSIKGIFHP